MNKFNSFSTDEIAVMAELLAEDFSQITESISNADSYNHLLYHNAFIVRGLISELEEEIIGRKSIAEANLRDLSISDDDIYWKNDE